MNRRQPNKRRDSGEGSTSATANRALQSIKCVMLLKRKLKRMRETKSANNQFNNDVNKNTSIDNGTGSINSADEEELL